jgi:ureidoacrylate peracid hydrolase
VTELLSTLAQRAHPDVAAVVVIDLQNDFCANDGAFGRLGYELSSLQQAAKNTTVMVQLARAVGVPIIHVRSTYAIGDFNEPMRERQQRRTLNLVCQEGTWGAEFYEVRPHPDDLVITKHRYNSFHDTQLDATLQALGVRSVLLAGVATNVCVESTAREAYFRGYYVTVLADCTGTTSQGSGRFSAEHLHDVSLENIRLNFGIAANTTDLARVWGPRD